MLNSMQLLRSSTSSQNLEGTGYEGYGAEMTDNDNDSNSLMSVELRRKRVDEAILFEMNHKCLREKGVRCLVQTIPLVLVLLVH